MARTPPPNIDPAPTPPPQRGDKSSFSQRVDAFVLWITAAVSQFLTLASNVYNNAVDAFASANSAAGAAGAAANSAYYAADSATAAAQQVPLAQQKVVDAAAQVALATQQAQAASGSATASAGSASASELSRLQVDKRYLGAKASGPTTDNQGAALQTGAVYYDTEVKAIMTWNGAAWVQGVTSGAGVSTIDGEAGALTTKTINGAAILGSGDITTPTTITRSPRTANAQLTNADRGAWAALSGTFTQTFATAATLGNGWTCFISNDGTGSITIPASDGRTNWIIYPGEVRLFTCDGAALYSAVLHPFTLAISSTSNFVRPPGYAAFDAELWGAGGGGGGGSNSVYGGGGGAGGGYFRKRFLASDFPAAPTGTLVSIGAGGVGGTSNNNGISGGNTSLLGVTATGGSYGGTNGAAASSGGNGAGITTDPYVGALGGYSSSAGVAGPSKALAGSGGGSGGGGTGAVGGNGGLRSGSPGPMAVGNGTTSGAPGAQFGGGAGGAAYAGSGSGFNGGNGGTASGGGGGGFGATGGTGGTGGDGYVFIRGV